MGDRIAYVMVPDGGGSYFITATTFTFDELDYAPSAIGTVNYPTTFGIVDGAYYVIGGNNYFVPDDPLPSAPTENATAIDGDFPIYGTSGNETIAAPDGDGYILYSGADTSGVGTGDDTLTGGTGDDHIFVGDGNDVVNAGDGDDIIGGWNALGGSGTNTLSGEAGDDQIIGGTGNDAIFGGTGADILSGGGGTDNLDGGADDDTFLVFDNQDTTNIKGGEAGGDWDLVVFLTAASSQGVLVNLAGSESGNYSFYGGTGTGTFNQIEAISLTSYDDVVNGSGSSSDIRVTGNDGADTITTGSGNDLLIGDSYTTTGTNLIVNGSFEDTTGMVAQPYGHSGTGSVPGWSESTGTAEINLHADSRGGLSATDGSNWLDLEGGPGQQHLIGQDVAGITDGDTYVIQFDIGDLANADDDTANDNAVEVIWNGEIIATINPSDGDWQSYEFFVVGGSGNGSNRLEFQGSGAADAEGVSIDNVQMYETVEGSGAGDTLDGGAGDDIIFGGAGDDAITGGAGDDTLSGGTGFDTFYFADNWGADSVWGGQGAGEVNEDALDFTSVTAGGITATFTGWEDGSVSQGANSVAFDNIEHIIGTNLVDVIDASADGSGLILEGRGGDDTITGGSGADEIWGGTGADIISAGDDADTIVIEDGFGTDVIQGGEGPGLGTDFDTLDFTNMTTSVTITFDGYEWGSFTDGADTASFAQIERLLLSDYGDFASMGADTAGIVVVGGAGDDTVWGGQGADTISGGDGADEIFGDSGNDTIHGDAGNDDLGGDAGDDTIYGGTGDDWIQGNAGTNLLYGEAGDDTFEVFTAQGGTDTIVGGSTSETGGDTLLFSGADNVTLTFVTLESGNYNAGTASGSFDDIENFVGGSGADRMDLTGVAGPLTIIFDGDGSGTISDGTTTITFSGMEEILASDQDDVIDASLDTAGTILHGNDGDDVITGGSGSDDLMGGAGNDTITSGDGNDRIWGDSGDDTFIIDEADTGADLVYGSDEGGDTDTLNFTGSSGANVTFGGWEFGSYSNGTATGDFWEIEAVIGSDGNDTIDAGASGSDHTIDTGAGDDVITGGQGNDTITTGDGDDRFIVENDFGVDSVDLGSAGETLGDAIDASAVTDGGVTVDWTTTQTGTLSVNVHALTFTDAEIFTLTNFGDTFDASGSGSAVAVDAGAGGDDLTGSDYDDTLTGGTGDDTFIGGLGADVMDGGDGDDHFHLYDGFGANTIIGGDTGEIDGDRLYGNLITSDVTVLFTGDDAGSYSDGTDTTSFTGIEALWTGSGNDSVDMRADTDGVDLATGTGSDVVHSGQGDDTINTANSGDTIYVYDDSGTDTISAGSGTDTLYLVENGSAQGVSVTWTALKAGTYTFAGGGAAGSFSSVENLYGTAFDDQFDSTALVAGEDADVRAGEGDDTYTSGAGDDTFFGEGGDDTMVLTDGFGTDDFHGGESAETSGDTIDASGLTAPLTVTFTGSGDGTATGTGGTLSFVEVENLTLTDGDDVLDGSADTDGLNIDAGDGADDLTGGTGADVLGGGTGDDTIAGGDGSDTLDGGAGRDTIQVAQGDSATGGDGDDIFTLADLGESGTATITITGGETGETAGDTLNLAGTGDWTDLVMTGAEDGSFTMADGTVVNFSEIENIVFCYEESTKVMTPRGPREIGTLTKGDLVLTADRGPQPIRWISSTTHRWTASGHKDKPIQIKAGALGLGMPARDLVVSPQHRILLPDEADGALVPAKSLKSLPGVRQLRGRRKITYVHMMFDRHEVVFAEGLPSESFYPGPESLKSLGTKDRSALRRLILRGASDGAEGSYPPARPVLTMQEGKRLARKGGAFWTSDKVARAPWTRDAWGKAYAKALCGQG